MLFYQRQTKTKSWLFISHAASTGFLEVHVYFLTLNKKILFLNGWYDLFLLKTQAIFYFMTNFDI